MRTENDIEAGAKKPYPFGEYGGRQAWRIGNEHRPLGVATLSPMPDSYLAHHGVAWMGNVVRDGLPFFDVEVVPLTDTFAALVRDYTAAPLDRRMRCALWLARARRYTVHEFLESFFEDLSIDGDPIICVGGPFDPRSVHALWHMEAGGGVNVRIDYLGVECGKCLGCRSGDRAEPTVASRVYFVQSAEGGPVKIGRSADPSARVASLQTANAHPLRVLATMPGGAAVERTLHRLFERHRVRPDGEWFHPAAEVLAFIRELGGRPA